MSIDIQEQDVRKSYKYIPDFITREEEEYLLRKISETPQPKWKNVTGRRLASSIDRSEVFGTYALWRAKIADLGPNLIERIASTGMFKESAHQAPNHVIINEYKPGEGIMPHEDGPAYHPVVATISLGSHAVFHYLQYQPGDSPLEDPLPSTSSSTILSKGRIIDKKPILSLLLEPRSVIITSGTLYKNHLHWIEDVTVDHIVGTDEPARHIQDDTPVDMDSPPHIKDAISTPQYRIDNWTQITGEREKEVVRRGGVLERETRVSLTCRDVAKVRKIGLLKR